MPIWSRKATDPVIAGDEVSGVSDPDNTLQSDLEQQQDRLLDKLAEAWLFDLKMLIEGEEKDR